MKMAEKKILIESREIEYEGLFDLKDFFLEVDRWLREHGYDRFEKHNYEQVTESGKQVVIELEPWKTLSDYVKAELNIEMEFEDMKDVEVEHDGVTEELQKGHVTINFQARLITDYENKWESGPVLQFFRTIIDKFVHKTQTEEFENECVSDCKALEEEMKSYLNLFRYKS